MDSRYLLALCLLCGLETDCQTFPRLSFGNNMAIPNHGYVDLGTVETSFTNSVQCRTDLSTCCRSGEGIHRGQWYFPDGDPLQNKSGDGDVYEFGANMRHDLRRRNSATSPTGIYRCEIPTNTSHVDTDISVIEAVYVGLYTSEGGDISISGGIIFDPYKLTLTCISTGGPATTVTWTRDSTTVTQGTKTLLDDPVTAQYNHTLTVTTLGLYSCTVSNNKPSTASAKIALGPSYVTAVQDGPTSIRVSWTPPSPLVGITGYLISYTGGSNSDSVNITGGDSYRVTQLTNGETYTITIRATSTILSESVHIADVPLVPFSAPSLQVSSVTDITIAIAGSVPADGSVVTGFMVQWQRDTLVGCSDEDDGSINVNSGFIAEIIPELEPGNRYFITATAYNAVGNGPVSDKVTSSTLETVPSSGPTSVRNTSVTASSITVQWGEVPCLDRNGRITGFRVQALRNGMVENMTTAFGGNVREATLSGLSPSTLYTVQVAAVNGAGTGLYSGVSVRTGDFMCTARGVPEVTVIDCTGNQPGSSLQCSFNGGQLHSCNVPMVLSIIVSPPGNQSVRIVSSTGEESTLSYSITTADPVSAFLPPLEVILTGGSPLVTESSVEAEFVTTRPVTGVRCFLRYENKNDYKDCSSGRVSFSDLSPGGYILKIYAHNQQSDSATAKIVVTI